MQKHNGRAALTSRTWTSQSRLTLCNTRLRLHVWDEAVVLLSFEGRHRCGLRGLMLCFSEWPVVGTVKGGYRVASLYLVLLWRLARHAIPSLVFVVVPDQRLHCVLFSNCFHPWLSVVRRNFRQPAVSISWIFALTFASLIIQTHCLPQRPLLLLFDLSRCNEHLLLVFCFS